MLLRMCRLHFGGVPREAHTHMRGQMSSDFYDVCELLERLGIINHRYITYWWGTSRKRSRARLMVNK